MDKSSINSKYIIQLLVKEVTHGLSEPELLELNEWLNLSPQNKDLYLKLYSKEYKKQRVESLNQYNTEKAWLSILDDIKPKKRKLFNTLLWQRIAVVASFLFIAGLTYHLSKPLYRKTNYGFNSRYIKPGNNKAVLTLANGHKVQLGQLDTTLLVLGSGISIKDSKVLYQSEKKSKDKSIVYNTLETPRGGEYSLVLSDGTKVWLNTASKIRYPQFFEQNKRTVYVQGEAYFEVAKNKEKPFFVHSGSNTIKVVGTAFNVRAYSEYTSTLVTLSEGSIELNTSQSVHVLLPNQQAIINDRDSIVSIVNVNSQLFTAWKDGKFLFKDISLANIMDDLSRWYNVNLFYTNQEVKTLKFSLYVNKQDKIDKILEMIEATEKVKFNITDNNLIISSK